MADINSQQKDDNSFATPAKLAAIGAGLYIGNKIVDDKTGVGSNPAKLYNHLLGTEYLERHMGSSSMSWKTADSVTLANQSVKKAMLSQMMALEEASPLHILRTLQLSNIFMPFVDISESQAVIKFSPNKLKSQSYYYQAVIDHANREANEQVRRKLKEDSLKQGLGFYKNSMYLLDEKGNIDKSSVVIPEARLSLSHLKHGDQISRNAMLESYAKNIKTNLDYSSLFQDQLMFVGGKSKLDVGGAWSKSWFRYATEASMKSLDNPLGGVEDLLRGLGAGDTSIFESKAWLTTKKYLNVNLGSGGNYNLPLTEMYTRSATNVAKKTAIGLLGYEVADSAVRFLAPADTLFSNGIYTGLTNLYASARLTFAEAWSDKFQGYKNSQEQIAPGSTSLLALAAIPMSGALTGAQLAYGNRLGKTAITNADEAATKYSVKTPDSFLAKLGLNGEYTPMKKNALRGGLIGAALAIPFLPGALIGESSEELRQQYSGEKEIAQKSNRFWFMGGTSWDGGHTKYFTKHNVARVNADGTDIVRYGDDDTKKKLNPILHPLAYLKNPYRYEQMHENDMPYPVWGMDVGYGSIYGKIYERTIGQIIKPDRINPAVLELAESAEKSIEQTKYGAFAKGISNALGLTQKNSIPMPVDGNMAGLIRDGLASSPESANFDPNLEAAGLTYQAGTDLIGLKGWVGSLPLKDLGISSDSIRMQLARSGEATSSARDFRDWNAGDLAGLGEFQRKILGTSSGSIMERYNPLNNNMVNWLPSNPNQYFIDFSKGNAYSKIERGEERLPGDGYAALNPDLKGINPEDYPLIYKYKILSDVAKGSREHIRARQQVLQAYSNGELSPYENKLLEQTLDQEVDRDNRKDFKEQSTTSQRLSNGPQGLAQGALWDIISTESPLEMLTPIRPIAKFIHNRTAIEDYVETQLGGTDAAIWTNPYSHFIKPALNKTRLIAERNFKGKEVVEKENIDEYFDKLGTIKNLSNSNPTDDYDTVVASSLSGLFTNKQVLKFKKSLSADQKDYFESFSQEKDEKKRDKIRAILPEDVLRGYEQIWRNSDIATKARERGSSVQEAIINDFNNNTRVLAKSMNTKPLSSEEKQKAVSIVDANKDSYFNMGASRKDRIVITQNEMIRKKIAYQESAAYVHNTTGSPSSKFMGWDPRLTADDIKIKTLSLGGEDLKRFGFWKKDEDRMNSISALNDEDQVIHSLSRIKADIHRNMVVRQQIDSVLFSNGYKTRHISIADSNYGMLKFKEEE